MSNEKAAQSPSEKTEWWVGADSVGGHDQLVIPSEDLRIFVFTCPSFNAHGRHTCLSASSVDLGFPRG